MGYCKWIWGFSWSSKWQWRQGRQNCTWVCAHRATVVQGCRERTFTEKFSERTLERDAILPQWKSKLCLHLLPSSPRHFHRLPTSLPDFCQQTRSWTLSTLTEITSSTATQHHEFSLDCNLVSSVLKYPLKHNLPHLSYPLICTQLLSSRLIINPSLSTVVNSYRSASFASFALISVPSAPLQQLLLDI